MENKELTAVDVLINQIEYSLSTVGISGTKQRLLSFKKQAKQKEREQMHKCASFWRGKENEIEKKYFDEYYKEKYGEL